MEFEGAAWWWKSHPHENAKYVWNVLILLLWWEYANEASLGSPTEAERPVQSLWQGECHGSIDDWFGLCRCIMHVYVVFTLATSACLCCVHTSDIWESLDLKLSHCRAAVSIHFSEPLSFQRSTSVVFWCCKRPISSSLKQLLGILVAFDCWKTMWGIYNCWEKSLMAWHSLWNGVLISVIAGWDVFRTISRVYSIIAIV